MNIDNIKIKNFKSLRDIELNLNNLTLITGVNSSGKSSFIEVILLFREKNKNLIEIENLKDIKYQDAKENEKIILTLNNDKQTNLNIFSDNFQYIHTNRIAPKTRYSNSNDKIKNANIGSMGEFTAHYLNINKNSKISINNLRHEKARTNRLIENVSLWLGEISSGIEIGTEIYEELNQTRLFYRYNYKNKKTTQYTPLNVGFGITYVLPIIVAILKAKEGNLLIIENPESHLHPAGQSKIAELCAIASANGVQIIVETHSDHFLNGIRVATKKGILTPEQSKVYYFRKEKDELETKIDEINIDKNGGIDRYPKGFFDQFDDDLDELLGL